ncbi:tetratricopeptide repeat protein [Phaeobacter sp. QD34_3]|uniref:tetratricopeptide repeat protein n=1 Tax=unclassified Phaeobacter TaxID=2621772 RepID=UPI00237F7DCB|nr:MULTISPECIES: tetratricopeptide repeat protein [unclassified Phaeobacter]MDE4133716.1 tetratricopeptide repeat protein [Phaeobacter sp. QD34_3]MDE4137351.1 tetratricopeptide repeat protein [Phaeobacter sp. QD34_24]MDE4176471.1 tetratricopeptide repeat protein [Phaeobacter sp. PT47_59]
MIANVPNLKAIVAATALTVTFSLPVSGFAQVQSPPDEADLLMELADADPVDASAIDRELQALWRKSGSPAMDLMLARGVQALERGDTAAAIEHLTALTDHAPGFARGWYERARAYFVAELYGPSVADLERALALNPNDYDAIFALGTLFEQFRDPETAYQAYLRAKAIHPNHEEVTKALDRLAPLVEGKEL